MSLTAAQSAEVRRIEDRHGPLVLALVGDVLTVGIQSHADGQGNRKLLRELDMRADGRLVAGREIPSGEPNYSNGDGRHGALKVA